MSHDQSLEALHDYRGEDYRPTVIQACHCGCLGMGMIVAVSGQLGTAVCWGEVLKMSASTSVSWCAQPLSTRPGMLLGPAALRGLILWRVLLTSAGVALRGSSSGEGVSLVLREVFGSSKRA